MRRANGENDEYKCRAARGEGGEWGNSNGNYSNL